MTDILIKIFIKNPNQTDNPSVRKQYGTLSGAVGIICNLLLFGTKFLAGFLTGAISITADAFNNLSDAGSSIMTLVGFRMAGKPADANHPYGHGRIEYVSGLLVSIVIVLMGFELIQSSFDKILHPTLIKPDTLSIIILIFSIALKFWMAGFNKKLGNKLNSASMKATATDSLSDCIATSSVLVAIFISRFTNYNLDGYIGILVAGFILYAGYHAAKETLAPLLGKKADPDFIKELSLRLTSREELIGFHDLMIHDYGPGRIMVTVHSEVPYPMDLMHAHDIIDDVEMEIKKDLGCDITIHMDPVILDDKEKNYFMEIVIGILTEIDERITIHDFRVSKGPLKTKLIFHVVVPFGFEIEKKNLTIHINEELKKRIPHPCYAVVEMDYDDL